MSFLKKDSSRFVEKAIEGVEKKWPSADGELAVDVYQTEKEIIVQAAVAGVKSDDIDVSIEKDILIIKGSRFNPNNKDNCCSLIEECYWGNFSRKIIIPDEIDPSRIQALMKDGVMTIKIPRIVREPKSSVKIKEE